MELKLLAELARVANNEKQKEILVSLWMQSKQKELTPNQKELANKLYKELRNKLILKKVNELAHDLSKIKDDLIDLKIEQWLNSEYLTKKDANEIVVTYINEKTYGNEQLKVRYLLAYGRASRA